MKRPKFPLDADYTSRFELKTHLLHLEEYVDWIEQQKDQLKRILENLGQCELLDG